MFKKPQKISSHYYYIYDYSKDKNAMFNYNRGLKSLIMMTNSKHEIFQITNEVGKFEQEFVRNSSKYFSGKALVTLMTRQGNFYFYLIIFRCQMIYK